LLIMVLAGQVWGADRILDDRGQAVALGAPPQRIVSLYGGLTEILQALGLGSRVVARIQGDDCLKDIPTVGTHLQPNVEMILALKPDLVVQAGVPKGLPALRKLEAEGVPVAMFAPADFPGLFSAIQRLGTLTGQDEAAAALTRTMAAKLAEVARRVQGRQPPRVFFEVRCQNLLAAGQGSLVNDIIAKAGGVNIVQSPQKLTNFSLETLIQANPEVYIIQEGPMNRSPEDIYTRPYFQELQAVHRRRVLVVQESLFSRPGPRSAEAVEQLARFLHPGAWGEGKP
jgi:iron complex transport system substrate-binding protein